MHRLRMLRLMAAMSLASVSLVLGLSPAWSAETASTAQWTGSEAQQKEWREGLTLVQSGQFDKGSDLINRIATAGVADQRVTKVQDWLKAYDKLDGSRAERRQADFAKYEGWVKEDTRDGKLIRAVAECAMAFDSAKNEDKFRKEPWVVQAVDNAVKAAQGFEKDGKWYKAARIYVQLEEIYPRNLDYRDAFLRCQEHIRLELSYTPTSDWESSCADITQQMAEEAFKRIFMNYIKEVSFQKSAEAGLKQLLLMTDTPKLAKVFKKLSNKEDVAEFRERIQTWVERVAKQESMSWPTMIEIFDHVLTINKETDLFPQTVLIKEFVQGALKPLDRFSDMLWPAETDEFNKHTQGVFTGVGISIRKKRNEPIKVITPLEDTPAYEAGVQPGDLIMDINGKPAAPLTIFKAVQTITGPPGTTVTLTIKRPSVEKPIEQKLVRAEITIYTVKGAKRLGDGKWDYLIDPDSHIGYMRVTNFTEKTSQEIDSAMKSMIKDHQAKGVILDLRDNPGGLLKSAVEVTNLFLSGEKEIVSTRDRRGKDMQMFTSEPEGDHYPAIPLIVLVNGYSASASEIVTGALQVHHRAWIVGERSFGKGSVQQVLPLTDRRAFLKLTTARYYLPNGRCLHRDDDSETWGVDPDVKIPLVPKEMVKVANMRLRQDILKGRHQTALTEADYERVFATRPADREDEPGTSQSQNKKGVDVDADVDADYEAETKEEAARDDENKWPEVDPQLDAAVLLMRVHLQSDQPWPTKDEAVAAKPSSGTGS